MFTTWMGGHCSARGLEHITWLHPLGMGACAEDFALKESLLEDSRYTVGFVSR